MIIRISEFQAGNETMKNVSYTVYYDSGRKVNYTGHDTLPMTVVNFLTAENTVSETVYINDDYNNCVNKRTVYTAPNEEPEAVTQTPAEQVQTTQPDEKPQEATTAPARADPDHSAQPMQEAPQNVPSALHAAHNAPMNGAGTPRTGAA